jgi:hypothetical protein
VGYGASYIAARLYSDSEGAIGSLPNVAMFWFLFLVACFIGLGSWERGEGNGGRKGDCGVDDRVLFLHRLRGCCETIFLFFCCWQNFFFEAELGSCFYVLLWDYCYYYYYCGTNFILSVGFIF